MNANAASGKIPFYYQGSVKNLLGPFSIKDTQAVIFEYSDFFSVFDWGRMPDLLDRKGEALAVLAADFFEKIEKAETWREFSKSSIAKEMRKANRLGSGFDEMGEKLQAEGLRTHYLGVLPSQFPDQFPGQFPGQFKDQFKAPIHLKNASGPFRRIVAKQMKVVRPELATVLGRVIPDYLLTREALPPKLIPLEVVFRMGCPEGSSLLARIQRDPDTLATLGLASENVVPGAKWDFPVLEYFTKLESTDRLLTGSEALAISGLPAGKLEELLWKTLWVAGLLKHECAQNGLELADGKVEWGLAEDGNVLLVDAIGPDELRILKDGVQLSKEFLRSFYRNSDWYSSVENAKAQAKKAGQSEWKSRVQSMPPELPNSYRDLASQVYLSLTNALTGKRWFSDAESLDQVVRDLKLLKKAA